MEKKLFKVFKKNQYSYFIKIKKKCFKNNLIKKVCIIMYIADLMIFKKKNQLFSLCLPPLIEYHITILHSLLSVFICFPIFTRACTHEHNSFMLFFSIFYSSISQPFYQNIIVRYRQILLGPSMS